MHPTTLFLIALSHQPEPTVQLNNISLTPRTITVEGSTATIADINRDGHADLLTAGRRIAIDLGDGRGGLRRHNRADPGEQPTELALADLNNDGHTDIVIANHDVHYITLLLGDGRGGFTPSPQSPLAVDVDPHPHTVAAADLDGDGHTDLLIDHSPRGRRSPNLRPEDGGVLVIRGSADGFKTPGTIFETGGIPYRGFALGDLNGDGRPDLAAPHDNDIGILLNTSKPGAISFERAAPVTAETPFAVRIADLNADGRPDIISASGEDSAAIQIFLADDRGGFAPAPNSPIRHARGGKNIIIADFNGDDIADAAVAAYRSDRTLIILGSATALTTTTIPAGTNHPWALAAGDLNNDGADDIFIAAENAREARLYLTHVPQVSPR